MFYKSNPYVISECWQVMLVVLLLPRLCPAVGGRVQSHTVHAHKLNKIGFIWRKRMLSFFMFTLKWQEPTVKFSFSYIWCSCLEKLIYNFVKFIRKLIYIQFCIKLKGLNISNSANMQQIWKLWYPRES